jgi:hypothetical protein
MVPKVCRHIVFKVYDHMTQFILIICLLNAVSLNILKFIKISPTWEATNFAAIQEITNILSIPNVHYCFHKSPSLVPILRQINSVHTTPSYLFNIHLHIIHPLCFGFPSGLLPSGFSTNNLQAFHFSPIVLHALSISSSSTWPFSLYLVKRKSYEAPHYAVFLTLPSFVPLWSNYPPQHPVLKHLQSIC